jgi:hypothetical protein
MRAKCLLLAASFICCYVVDILAVETEIKTMRLKERFDKPSKNGNTSGKSEILGRIGE